MPAPNKESYRIMGIDPGTNYMGYGVVEVTGFSGKQIAVPDTERHIHFQRVIAKIFPPEKFACRLLQLRLFPSVGVEGLPQRRKPV